MSNCPTSTYSLIHDDYTPIFLNCVPELPPCGGPTNGCQNQSVFKNNAIAIQSMAVLSDNSMFVVGTLASRALTNSNFSGPLVGGYLYYTTTFFNDSNPVPFNLPLASPGLQVVGTIFCCAWNPVLTPDGDTTLALLLDDLFTIQLYSVRQLLTSGVPTTSSGSATPIYPYATIIMSNLGWSSISFDQNNNLYGVVPQSAAGSTGSVLYRIFSGAQSGAIRVTPVPVCTFAFQPPTTYTDNTYGSDQTVFCDNSKLQPSLNPICILGVVDCVPTPFQLVSPYGPYYINFTQVVFSPDGNLYLIGTYPFYNLWNRTMCCGLFEATASGQPYLPSPCYYSDVPGGQSVSTAGIPYAISKYNGLYVIPGGIPASTLAASPALNSLPASPAIEWVAPNQYSLRNSTVFPSFASIIPQWLSLSTTTPVLLTLNQGLAILT